MDELRRLSLLLQGGGHLGQESPARRLRHRLRTVATEHPAVYLPFARRKYPGPSPRVIGSGTQVVIDGFTRSASTYAVYAFQVAQQLAGRPLVPLAHHLHAPAQIMTAARRGVPTIMVIREPHGAVLSQVVREPGVDLLDALWAYHRFHEFLLPFRDALVVADFAEVTGDFGAVVRRANRAFETSFAIPGDGADEAYWRTRLIQLRPTLSPVLLGFESGEVSLAAVQEHVRTVLPTARGERTWMPSAERDRAKSALEAAWADPRLDQVRSRAEAAYRVFVRGARRAAA
jgi:peptidoglycan hydrolase-like protein with peptidoglycan-binding domain